MSTHEHVVLLVGGVGGAKLALGLAEILPPEALTIIVNTGDDFTHLGLHVSPDLDTVMYTLGGIAHKKRGWGLEEDTLKAMDMVHTFGGPAWFNLGDADLGTNIYRTSLLAQGCTLTEITRGFCDSLGIDHAILPMTDDQVCTLLDTEEFGLLEFQHYFVRERWQPVVKRILFDGAAEASPSAAVERALHKATLILFGPSNPFLSIDPILAVPGIRSHIERHTAPVVAVSPIVDGTALKGPAAKLMHELKLDVSPQGVADHYGDLIDGLILDTSDAPYLEAIRQAHPLTTTLDTIMKTKSDKVRLAQQILDWIEEHVT